MLVLHLRTSAKKPLQKQIQFSGYVLVIAVLEKRATLHPSRMLLQRPRHILYLLAMKVSLLAKEGSRIMKKQVQLFHLGAVSH
ncbi:hypothetical protein OESDEN_00170 [Oesophagostomum dentatum]|uniref:Uncharacterized protein n=1 Tax=Oesophagostomum dentatum TaxID=61180 RepID=A0A0B1TUL0_OESDE|nr:hypothetical protein OESDEN_00170 [Oesophagostomum dentatum]